MNKNIFVNTADSAAKLTAALKNAGLVAVDTEADSMHHYFEKVCLVQVTFGGTNYIVDPLAGIDLKEFFEALSQKDLIIHAADNDLRLMKKAFGFRAKKTMFDTMYAAQVMGLEKIGLQALVEKYFGFVMSKSAQRSDWSIRPLTQKMLDYAAGDTQYLEELAGKMTAELQQMGRLEWHRQLCERLVRTVEAPEKPEEPRDEWRVKGSSGLAPNELAFVRELWKWRDVEARRRDRPPFMVLHNEDLVELAKWQAANPGEPLEKGPVFMKRFKDDLRTKVETALRTAASLPPSEWPPQKERLPWYEKRFVDKKKVEPLVDATKKIAEKLKIQSGVLASWATLTTLVDKKPQTVEQMIEVSGMLRWQAELVYPEMKRLQGKA